MKLLVVAFLVGYAWAAYYEDTYPQWVEEINNDPSYGFKAGYNPYLAGKSLEGMKRLMGTKLDRKSKTKALPRQYPDFATPSSFISGQDKWQPCQSTISYVKDQADCGSCWAVAASSVIADRMCINNIGTMSEEDQLLNEPLPPISMSGENIMSCCTWCGDGCQGGYMIDAMKYYNWVGVPTGGPYGSTCGCQPYQIPPCPNDNCTAPEAPTPACSSSCRSGYSTNLASADKHFGTNHYEVPGVENMKKEIMMNGPIECGFEVYENFMHYQAGGIYSKKSGQDLGGHAITILGWGEQNGVPYWVCQNSWNSTWGMNGRFYFKMGIDLCGMEDQCVAATAMSGDKNFKLTC